MTSRRTETVKQEKESGTSLRVPVPIVGMRVTDVHLPPLPGEDALAKVRSALPSPPSLAFIAGLAVMGILSILEWPVVVVAVAGVTLTDRMARKQAHIQQQPEGPEGSASDAGDE
ncbi:hypothetical protein [Kutzneria buriramensis]|uniref:hypothetical protein n=1 Tax=Kutzneria buriramensis TaxID=1045776 RepID=UPI0011C164DC|nr:hypothetical protein [Kutzneria buriramensis]